MANRSSHTGKSYKQKETYKRYLPKIDYEPTVDESLEFKNTEKPGEDLSESKIKKKRKPSFKNTISEHFSENWFKYILGGIVIIGVFLVYESRNNFSLFDYKLNQMEKSIDKLNGKVNSIDNHINDQEKVLIEQRIKIEYLEKKLE